MIKSNSFITRFFIFTMVSFFIMSPIHASTHRIAQFSNDHVSVWKTIIYSSSNNSLEMHRHDHDRVVVALTDGLIKVTNDKGQVHYVKLVKDKAYYLTKDIPNELHSDQNMSSHPVKVMVIELK